MKSIAITKKFQAQTSVQARRLLMVAPKPPPIGGSPLTVQAMLAELALYPDIHVTVINTSPSMDVRKNMDGFNFEKVFRTLLIVPKFIYEIRGCDAVLVFANDLFAITLVPILLFLARLFHKPFFLKPVAASLDLFINAQKKPLREYLLMVLRGTDGILAQTRRLHEDLGKLGCSNVYYLPGCRTFAPIPATAKETSSTLRLIFLAHVSRLKGTFILLDALKILNETSDLEVSCDYYGPIINDIHDEFMRELKVVPNAHYCGIAEPGTGAQLIAKYDALVLPTYHDTEGHPGVLIEAMSAGVPVITTQIRTLPELVTDGVNGFLVPTQDSAALAEAIRKLAADPALRKLMGVENHRKGQEFRSDVVVAELLNIIFPNVSPLRDPR